MEKQIYGTLKIFEGKYAQEIVKAKETILLVKANEWNKERVSFNSSKLQVRIYFCVK